jgi:hypothetical protein
MAISPQALRVVDTYFRVVDHTIIGNRLQQVWDALNQSQRNDIKLIIKNLYYRMFTYNLSVDVNPVETIILIEPYLTGPQKSQIFNLMKSDIEAAYNEDKDEIDADIAYIIGTNL